MPFVDELLVEIPAFEERLLDALVVEGVEDVADVAAVDVVFAGVDDDGAGEPVNFVVTGLRRMDWDGSH